MPFACPSTGKAAAGLCVRGQAIRALIAKPLQNVSRDFNGLKQTVRNNLSPKRIQSEVR